MHHERTRHPGLDDRRCAPRSMHRMLGAAEDIVHRRAREPSQQTATGDAAQHIVMTQGDAHESAAEQGGSDVADDGFDFGELGHRARKSTTRRRRLAPRAIRCRGERPCPRTRSPRPPLGSAAGPRQIPARRRVTLSTRPPLARRTPSASLDGAGVKDRDAFRKVGGNGDRIAALRGASG